MIAILDLRISNLSSIFNGIYVSGFDPIILDVKKFINDHDKITHLIIPGVGNYGQACKKIDNIEFRNSLNSFLSKKKPLMGICLGMQILFESSDESPGDSGLGLLKGNIKPLKNIIKLRVPHVGWNNVYVKKDHPLLEKIKQKNYDFYFVHSYSAVCKDNDNILAVTNYEIDFPSIVGKNNIIGFQFHPEKSQTNGLNILELFCKWDGQC